MYRFSDLRAEEPAAYMIVAVFCKEVIERSVAICSEVNNCFAAICAEAASAKRRHLIPAL